nr:MAG TPA: hypothetical protein [Caudoviricetes sp.]
MATETKINDIASQLSTASRLVVSTDFFWVYTASGLQVKIPAEFVKAYLVNGIKPSINANGNWEIDGKDLGVAAKGKTPQFRGGTMGIEVSYDDGKTWTQAVAYTDMNPDLTALVEAYNKVIQGEAGRVNAETARVKAEKARVAAENKRETDFSASKKACDDATAKANSTYSHPPYVDKDGYYYKWNVTTSSYNKTDVNLTGKAFQIKKVFASVSAMNATDVNTFAENDFILINTVNVEDADNAKLYVVALNEQGHKFYSYLVDMSGFRGFTGKTPQFLIGNVITLAEDANATASVSASGTDTNGNPVYKLNLGIPRGIRLRFADLTDSDKVELMKPATDAAAESKKQTEACKTATDNANTQETVRQKAETTRNLNETTRQKQETVRQEAETTRNNNEAARKTAETKRQQDTSSAITNSQTQTAIAKELNEHPVKIGDNGNWWQWNIKTHAYEDTGIVARGGAMYPTFKHVGNKLYIVDYGSNVSERVVKKGNKLVFRI